MTSDLHPAAEIVWQSASMIARRIAAGELSATEVIEAHLQRIAQVDAALNAFTVRMFDAARQQAEAADRSQRAGRPLGPLHGVPITIKDLFDVAGTPSTLGLARLRNNIKHEDAALVRRLRAAGAIVLGKTNVGQLMISHESENPVFGRTNNPWNLDCSPGGSSGGEAALIAAGGSALGLGSDLGGSIRQPAHSTGICGLKPTSGRLSTVGCHTNFPGMQAIPLQPGPLARTVEDLELAMRVLVDCDWSRTSTAFPPVAWRESRNVDVSALRVAYWWDDAYFLPSPAIRRAVEESADALRAAGATVEAFAPPQMPELVRLYLALLSADGTRGLQRIAGSGPLDASVRRMFRLGGIPRRMRPLVAAWYRFRGQERIADLVRHAGARSADEFLQLVRATEKFTAMFIGQMRAGEFDALLFPPHGLPALVHGTSSQLLSAAANTFLANVLGFPAGVVPVTRVRPGEESDRPTSRDLSLRTARRVENASTGLPVGVQVASLPWREDITLALMRALEEHFAPASDYPSRPPI